MDSQVQLVFFGEVIRGHRRGDVMHDMGELLELDAAECAALFSGARIVLKAQMDFFEAQGYEERLRELGARVHIEPAEVDPDAEPTEVSTAPPPLAAVALAAPHAKFGATSGSMPLTTVAPAAGTSASSGLHGAAAPGAAAGGSVGGSSSGSGSGSATGSAPGSATGGTHVPSASMPLVEPEVTCPNCGETQPNRIMCRACGTDIAMAIAHKREVEAETRALRMAQARARRGLPPLAGDGADADAPSAWGLGFTGRLARLPYITGMALVVAGINLLFVFAVPHPSPPRLYTMIFGCVLLVIFALRLSMLRAHDFNGSGWWALLLLVPYVGPAVALALMALPGMDGENEHGGRPRSGNPLIALMTVMLMTVMLVATYRWVATLVEEVIPTGRAASAAQTENQIAARLPSPDAVSAFRDGYMAAARHKAFAVSSTGSWGWTAGAASSESAAAGALASCDAKRKLYTPACELVNVNDSWVQR